MKFGCKFAFALIASLLSFQTATAQIVQTVQGKVEGQKLPNSTVTAFRGIPYAAPPVGDLRWRPSQQHAAWQGVRKATEFGASCMQFKTGARLPWSDEFMVQNDISEDCLFLNVWTPKVKVNANLPVIFFMHGGGYGEGSGAIEVYRGSNLAAKGVVVVTINYRLGVFGFLAHPELTAESDHHSSGEYGLLDQIAALKWVNDNIANFGGNPHNSTIWGQSAGAASVGNLVASPLAAGLFQHAQADSGLGLSGIPMTTLSAAEENGAKFAEEHHAASIKELRAMPAEALIPDLKGMMSGAGMRFSPVVDGWVMPDSPNNMSEKGTDNDVSVITGYNAGDAGMGFGPPIQTLDAYHQMVQKRYGEMAEEFEKLYPVSSIDEVKKVTTQVGQDRIRVSAFLWAVQRMKNHRSPVFTYYFDRAIPWPQHPEFGAFHTGELPYFFLNQKMLDRPWEQVDFTVAKDASSYLVNFATKGDPNGAGLPAWPRIDADKPQTMEIGAHTGVMTLADPAKVDFWTRYFNSPVSKSASPF